MSKSPSKRYDVTYYEMNSERHTFLNTLIRMFKSMISKRYRAGQKEHGGDLWLKATYPMLGSELIDAYTYYQAHRIRMRHWLHLLSSTHPIVDTEREAVGIVIQELIEELSSAETTTETLSQPSMEVFDASDS